MVVGIGEEFERIGGTEHVQYLGQGHLEVVEKAADGFNPKVKRQIAGVERLLERSVIDSGQDVLRLSSQIGRGGRAGVVSGAGIEMGIRNVVFEDFIDQVD